MFRLRKNSFVARTSENFRDNREAVSVTLPSESGDLSALLLAKGCIRQRGEVKKTGCTVNPSRRTVLERLTFSRPVSSGLTNRERDGYEITIALGSPLQLSASMLTSPSRVSSAPCASQSKIKRFIDIKSSASSAIGASKSISRSKIPLDRKANRVVHGSGYYGQLLVSIARDSFVAETKGAKSVSFTDQTDI